MAIYKIKYKREKVSDIIPLPVSSAKEAVDYLMNNCYDKDEMWREKVFAIFLNNKCTPIGHIVISIGGFDSADIDKRLIVKGALDSFATGVVLSHNHPSGDSRPSSNDIKLTKELKNALSVFDITLVDHIVIGDGEYFSFADEVVKKNRKKKKAS